MSDLLINIDNFRSLTRLSVNVEQKSMEPHIRTAQLSYLKPVICDILYNELLTANGNYTSLQESLMSYIRPFLTYCSYALYIPSSGLQSTRTGFVKQSGENATGAENDELKTLISDAWSRTRDFKNQLIDFLKDNEDDYPDWKNSRCYCNKKSSFIPISKVGKGIEKKHVVHVNYIGRTPE